MSETMQDILRDALESNCQAWGCVDPRIAAAEMARKALETMRKATPTMEYAGGTKLENLMYGGDPEYTGISFTDMGIVFREMIDAGLNPSPQPNDKSPAELESNSTTTI